MPLGEVPLSPSSPSQEPKHFTTFFEFPTKIGLQILGYLSDNGEVGGGLSSIAT
ncbi:hypothetical protein CCP3SC1AL1_1290003 [Gammaproteobacteria bacterium]